jgi:hypothetical protein
MGINSTNRLRLIYTIIIALIAVLSGGCAKFIRYEYTSHVFPLDGKSELVVSTFSSGYPETQEHVPFLFKSLQAPQSVYFEFFVRAVGTSGGRNPNIESIHVKNFSYEFPGQLPVTLLKDYSEGFWQQGRRDYGSDQLEPVPCFQGWYLRVKFDLVLNGKAFKGEHVLHARELSRRYPLIYDALR